jgi:NADH-quinone oxidoreductase subunit N
MVDAFTLLYQVIILIAALACCTLSHAYESYKDNREELYILMLSSVTGAMLMVASSHYASFFISLELMSIPVYGLLAYTHQRSKSLEAGEVLGAFSNSFGNVVDGYGLYLRVHRFNVVL